MRAAQTYRSLALAAAATALVAGCGSSSSGGSGGSAIIPSGAPGGSVQALLAGSVDKTLGAKNAKIRLDFNGTVAGQQLAFGGDGVADFVGKKFQLSLQLPAAAGISGTIEERIIGKDIYLKFPAADSAVTGGKPWVKVDPSELSASSKTGLDLTGQDPTQLLTTLRGVSDSVTKVGTAEVRGVPTTHYRAEIDLAKAVKASGADSSSLDTFTKTLGTKTIPEDVYLDSSGLARRFSVSIKPVPPSSSAASSAGPVSVTVTVDLYDFGNADTSAITAPPASEVGTLPTGIGSGSATG